MANDTVVISNGNINEYVITGEWSISAKVKPDQDSTESKKVVLKYQFNNTSIGEVISSALKDKRINWQSKARKGFNSIVDGSTITVKFEGGREPVDPRAQALAYFATLTPEQREALLNQAK